MVFVDGSHGPHCPESERITCQQSQRGLRGVGSPYSRDFLRKMSGIALMKVVFRMASSFMEKIFLRCFLSLSRMVDGLVILSLLTRCSGILRERLIIVFFRSFYPCLDGLVINKLFYTIVRSLMQPNSFIHG